MPSASPGGGEGGGGRREGKNEKKMKKNNTGAGAIVVVQHRRKECARVSAGLSHRRHPEAQSRCCCYFAIYSCHLDVPVWASWLIFYFLWDS